MTQYLRDIYDAVVTALKGMGITGKHLTKKPVTLQYPDERWVLPERFKGFIYNDIQLCDACLRCARVCPVDCIYIETVGKGKDRFMHRYAVDYNKCIWCSLCTLECPTGACQHSHDYDHAVYDRRRLVYEFVDPANPVPCHKERRRQLGWFVPGESDEVPRGAKRVPSGGGKAAGGDAPATGEPADTPDGETKGE